MKLGTCIIQVTLLVCFSASAAVALGGDDFPLRAEYAEERPISTAKLAEVYEDAIIVDSRNSAEYEVVHVAGAHNLLVGKMKKDDLLKLRTMDADQPLVFYCNGTTCAKSYKAAKKARVWGFTNVYVYDAGVFEWAKSFPTLSEFFGEPMTPESAQRDLIAAADFDAHCLDPDAFEARTKDDGYMLIDLRDREDRTKEPMKLAGIKKVTFDEFRTFLKKDRVIPKSKILVLDNVGKQVKWLQYYLEKHNRTDYYFLKGGVRAWKAVGK